MSTMRPAAALRTESCIISGVVQQHTNFLCRAQTLHTQQRRRQSSRRNLHSTSPKDVAISLPGASLTPSQTTLLSNTPEATMPPPLAALPLSHVLRTYLITAMSSSPILLGASTSILRTMLETKNPLLRIDKNPIMKTLLMKTFYKQFCAGGNDAEVAKTCAEVRQLGYSGVVLEYALEVLKDVKSNELEDVAIWRKGMLDSIRMAAEGDFVALKWSGMGPAAMRRMAEEKSPSKEMTDAMKTVCKSAAEKNIALLPSAEETWNLKGYHNWTLDLQRAFNRDGKCIMYNTYQLYLKQAPGDLAQHLKMAKDEGFTLGAKLVRGAYLATEKRDLIWPTIEATHNAYDTVMAGLIKREYNSLLRPADGKDESFPGVRVVVASHNSATVKIAQELRREQAARGETLTPLVYSQLQGMADEVSCSLLAAAKENKAKGIQPVEKVYKFTSWGSMFECLNYLLRRAAENKDAASRTGETKAAMRAELWRRCKGVFGLA